MAKIIAINVNSGEKQEIPEDWIGHPVIGKDFRLPKSTAEGKPQGIGRRRASRATTRGNKRAAPATVATEENPVSGGDTTNKES